MRNINKGELFKCIRSFYKENCVQYIYNKIYKSNYPNTVENEYHNDLLWNGNWIDYFEKIC